MKRKHGATAHGATPPARSARLLFPDFVTALNLVAGVLALYAAILGDTTAAILLVLASMVFDFFDGRIARFLKQEHALGVQLDSLADMVSFGVAPGVIILVMYGLNHIILVAVALYAVAGAFRLARFNLKALSEEKITYFIGLPIPAAALLVLAATFLHLAAPWQAAVILAVAILMVATFRLKKL